jgi:putative SOS response-associated peptidase YedK
MCARFTQHYTWSDLLRLYRLTGPARNLEPHYNLAPTDTAYAVLARERGLELAAMRWGLIPWWWKKPAGELPASFNARAETAATKPMFRDAFKRSRCIIPASGYYEWESTPSGKQPFYITSAAGPVLSFAGLWDRWRDPATGEKTASCTIIVTAANDDTRAIHDRMPVVLAERDVKPWLAGTAGSELLKPAPNDALRSWPVSRLVNRPGQHDDDPSLIAPLAEEMQNVAGSELI